MANASERKQALVGWANNNAGFNSGIQLQKFLFFYECFSKVDGDTYELDGLKGYKNGPVFSGVYGDNRYDAANHNPRCNAMYAYQVGVINEPRAKLSAFLVDCLGSKISDFTHKLNIWAAKEDEIKRNPNVSLDEADFSEKDGSVFRNIERAYPESYIDSVNTLNLYGKTFIYFKNDKKRLTETVHNALNEAAHDPEFDSPVYITFGETGELLLD
ncbi:MAG: hypothetical protein FWH14_01960 [Oscillospiraceae bacterium]|nr:hypothetical protein [Oscillospiraceae bacterium]